MNIEKLVDTVVKAGTMLIESGAEIYRVEETMVRICKSYPEVEIADSFVTATGIMMSVMIDGKTTTRIARVRSKDVDMHVIDQINSLSRQVCQDCMDVDELSAQLDWIANEKRYSFWTTALFGAIGAAGFALLFQGSIQEIFASFLVGFMIRLLMEVLSHFRLNTFLVNLVMAAFTVMMIVFLRGFFSHYCIDVVTISSIMLLVPGLAITNAIRDTIAGDYLSGLARSTEAILVAIAIAMGVGFSMRIFL